MKKIILILVVVLVLGSGILYISKIWDQVYYEIYSLFLYDHILYNGESYYISGSDDVTDGFVKYKDKEFHLNTSGLIEVYLVGKNNVPFDEGRTESAMTYHGDDDVMFIYYGGGVFTRDPDYMHKH